LKNIIFFILFFFSFGIETNKINLPPNDFIDWIILQNNETWIGWVQFEDFPICKTERILNHNMLKISEVIEDKKNYPNIFERLTQVKLYRDDILHIYLDMPFPVSSRDYIVKYEYRESRNLKEYYFYSVDYPNSIQFDDSIHLPNAGGKWILEELNNNQTKVTYLWNGELLGEFPNWALKRAWTTQGNEVLDWLNSALYRTE